MEGFKGPNAFKSRIQWTAASSPSILAYWIQKAKALSSLENR